VPTDPAAMDPAAPFAGRTIAILGAGMMAEAIVAGLLRGSLVEAGQIVTSHPRAERRAELAARLGIRVLESNREILSGADVVILAIKPQMLARVGGEIAGELHAGQLVISILAGATTRAVATALRHDRVVRSMPNTPARVGVGMTVWYATPATSVDQRRQAATLLGALGAQIEVDDERLVAMATAVSGTGPTYVFLVMEALVDAAVHLGFARHVAHDLVVETLEGSATFAKQSGLHPAVLRNMVTSPGGTSAAALHELESGRLRTVLSEAVWAAYRRTVELGEELESTIAPSAAAASGTRLRGEKPRDRP
jgi:pyrroline-5-carboxylate reductase